MDLTDFLKKVWDKGGELDPITHKLIEMQTKLAARGVAEAGRATGWDGLRNMGKTYQADPSRAVAHGAEAVGSYFAAPYLMSAMGAGGGAVGGGGGLTGSGIFAGEAATTQELLAQQAAQQAALALEEQAGQQTLGAVAQQGGKQALSSGGLFSGPSMMGPGGIPAAPGMESRAALDAVRLAKEGGYLSSPLEYAKEWGKAQMMNMDQPGEWMSRAGRNLGGMAKSMGPSMAMNALKPTVSPQQGYRPPPVMPMQQHAPDPMQAAVEDLKAGRITMDEFLRRIGGTR